MPLVTVKTKKGRALLHEKSLPVDPQDPSLPALIEEMIKVVTAHEGIGLASPQVGALKRVILVRRAGQDGKQDTVDVYLNPEIGERARTVGFSTEGCLSVPGVNVPVMRASWVVMSSYRIKNGARLGRSVRRFDGLEARIVQHEVDHLDGILLGGLALEPAPPEPEPAP